MLYNKDRLLALMDKHDLAGVVAATPENIYYLSGHASWSQNGYRYGGSQVYVVYPRDPKQAPALLIPGGDVGYASLDEVLDRRKIYLWPPRNPHIADMAKLSQMEQRTVKLAGSDSKGLTPEKALAQLIKDKGLDKGASAWITLPFRSHNTKDPRQSAAGDAAAGLDVFPLRAHDQDARGNSASPRSRRDQRAGDQTMLRACRPRVTENELASIYKGEIAKAGGQVYWMHMAVSRGGNFPALKDNVLQKGDIFRVDMGCSFNGYHADVCKSGCVGAEPTAEHRKRYDAIQAGVLKSVEALKPAVAAARTLRNHDRRRARQRPAELFQLLSRPHDWIRSARVPISPRPGGRSRRSISPQHDQHPRRARHDDESRSVEP
jgi:Xaa-Pro aminopeptidase